MSQKDNQLIQDFIANIIGQGQDYSIGRREHANNVLKDFFDNVDNVNSEGDFDVMETYKDSLNPYFPEYRNVRSIMDSTLDEKRGQYDEYTKGIQGARNLIEDPQSAWGTAVWLRGDPEEIFKATKNWTMKDITRVANEIRTIKSRLAFGKPEGNNENTSPYGQNFTAGRAADKVIIDQFNHLDNMFQIVLADAAESKKHTFNVQKSVNGVGISQEVMIPLLTQDNIRAILTGDMNRYDEIVTENKTFLQKEFKDNVSALNRYENMLVSFANKKVLKDGKEVQLALTADDALTYKMDPDNPMDNDITNSIMQIQAGNEVLSVEQAQDVVDLIESKLVQLRNSNDGLNYAHLKWSNEPIYSLKEQVFDYEAENEAIDEKGVFTYNLGLYNTDGDKVPDQMILQDLERETRRESDERKSSYLNNMGG